MRKIYHFIIKKYKPLLLFCMVAFASLRLYAQPCTLTATTVGFNAAYNQIYVLTDNNGIILDQNITGSFTVNAAGTYFIHALNYDPLDPPNPLPAALVGLSITGIGGTSAGCYNSDFLTDNVQRICGCESFCAGSSVVITTSGFNAAYSQVYVLTDSLGAILAVNNSGDFTAEVNAGHTYNVYALNYNPTDPPIPFPITGGNVFGVGDLTPGCMNSDFLTDVHCINVTDCNVCQQNHDILQGDTYTSDCSSFAAGAYTQIYFLVDSLGFVEAISPSGFFAYNYPVGSNHKVYALNYNPSDPPIPLPTNGENIATIGTTSSGCYNSNFLNDFICMKVIAPMVLAENDLRLTGRKGTDKNFLDWKVNATAGSDYFELEKSENGQQFTKIATQNGLGFTQNQQYYTYTDSFPASNKIFYRVRERDFDGNVYVSNTVLLQNVQSISTQVFPNPFKNELSIVIEGASGDTEFLLYNDLGQAIFRTVWDLDKPLNQFTISTAKLAI